MKMKLTEQLCEIEKSESNWSTCQGKLRNLCLTRKLCSIKSLDQKQIGYIESLLNQNLYLEACPGSGKTEVLSLKVSYEITKWQARYSGIAVLTFTNSADKEIQERISTFLGKQLLYPHYVGTFTSWLHGYIANIFAYNLMNYNKDKDGDNIRIIDDDIETGFINAFSTKYQYGKLGHIKANQYYYRKSINGWILTFNDVRNQNSSEKILNKDWKRKDFRNTKIKFWGLGFYNYEDIEYLVYHLLKDNPHIAKIISNRFPIIFIDECQDLSIVQMEIIDLLKEAGSYIHLIGDLNQSIYEFRYVEPQKILNYIAKSKFNIKRLNINYRSCQKIVNLCRKLVKNKDEIIGNEKTIIEKPLLALLYEKDNEIQAVKKFEDLINEENFKKENCMVIVRGTSLKNKLIGYKQIKYNVIESYAISIYLGTNHINIDEYKEGIGILAYAIQKSFFNDVEHGNKLDLYCPKDIDNKLWRISLGQILNELITNKNLNNVEWTWNMFRKNLVDELKKITKKILILDGKDCNIGRLRNKTGDKTIKQTLVIDSNETNNPFKVSTIHGAKGLTLDAVLVVSASNNTGGDKNDRGYHWRQWFNNDDISEKNRLAYVAFSRAKYLLAVAIPKTKNFSSNDRERLESLGFNITDCSGS